MRPAPSSRLYQTMLAAAARPTLETQLAELLMRQLAPCDLGDGIEVVHDVESVEIEMQCDLDDDAPLAPSPADDNEPTIETPTVSFDPREDLVNTTEFAREPVTDDLGTRQFVRDTAPYERIEIQLDANAFMQATIEEAKTIPRASAARDQGWQSPGHVAIDSPPSHQ